MQIGVDIVEIKRIQEACQRKTFLKRFFTERELSSILPKRDPSPHISGKYAAKEAVAKVLGTGFRYFKWQDIEILNNTLGKPYVVLSGKALELFNTKGLKDLDISISHSREYAIAFAVAVENTHPLAKTKEDSHISSFFKPYPSDVHKGSFGKIFIIAGSRGMTGAAALAGLSAMRSGAGLVTVGVPESLNHILEVKLTEAMTLPLSEGSKGSIGKNALQRAIEFSKMCDVIALGPGLSLEQETQGFVQEFVSSCEKTMVIDADALNALSFTPDILKNAPSKRIITPHPGELARLLSTSIYDIQQDRIGAVKAAAKEFRCITVLKGKETLVSDGDLLWVNPTGNPGMATGGSGDVLTGMIAAFLARGMKPEEAAIAGVYIHGLAGDLAALKKGQICLIASDIIEFLPAAFKQLIVDEREMETL